MTRACGACLARAWLLARLAGHLDSARGRIFELLELPDEELIAAVAGRDTVAVSDELAGFDPEPARARAGSAGLTTLCRCQAEYPSRLSELPAPPAVLHIAGDQDAVLAGPADGGVAIVGSRRPSAYGASVARGLGRGIASAGLTVLSGMALGIDSQAHRGALEAGSPTVAVLGGAAERAYPTSARALHARIRATGAIVSELPPGTRIRRWMFPARNRMIAALAGLTVVVEARPGSGALLTAAHAQALGRPVGAVPGHVSSPLASGPHSLLAAGARLVRGPEDVLEALFGAGARERVIHRPRPPAGLERVLFEALAEGVATSAAFLRAGVAPDQGLAALASLELGGYIRRGAGGRYVVIA